ncbi:MAG: glycosyltransferase family 39 protein [Anaerolineales bacterium]|nr:glycosyltransferase family 39 protein [Anaerolineales bacterium]
MTDIPARSKSITRIILTGLTVLALLAALGYLIVYLYIAARRMGYPYELEWIESGFVGQVGRILSGQNVYQAPSIEFTPFLYTPLYFYLSAAAAKITGAGFLPLRLVSVISSLVAIVGIFALVFRRSRNFAASLLAAGLFAASYRITGAWLDVARVDSLAIALLVLFCLALPPAPNRIRWLTAGVLAGLMVLTKQTMVLAVAPLFAVHLVRHRARAMWVASGFLLALVPAMLYLNITTEGWFSFYALELLGQQAEWLGRDVIVEFWKTDILRHYFVSLGIAAAGLFLILRERQREFWEWLALLAGALLCAFLARIKAGGYDNVLLPAAAMIAILFGIGWARITGSLLKNPNVFRDAAGIALAVAALYQFYHLRYNPADQLPTARHYATGEAFVEYLAEYPGDVYVPYHTQYAVMAGKPAYAHQAALWDVLRGESDNRGKQILAREIEESLRARRFDAVILDGDGQWNFLSGLEEYYAIQAEALPADYGPTPLTGWLISPRLIFLPKDNPPLAMVSPGNGLEYLDNILFWGKMFPYLNTSRRFV